MLVLGRLFDGGSKPAAEPQAGEWHIFGPDAPRWVTVLLAASVVVIPLILAVIAVIVVFVSVLGWWMK